MTVLKLPCKRVLFDVTMRAYDGAEVFELVETFSLASVYIMTTDYNY